MSQSTIQLPAELSDKELKLISDLVYSKFGIVLTPQKRALIVGRLQKVLKAGGFTTFSEYYDSVIADKSGTAITTLIDRISTNHTYFFREREHFDFFVKTALPTIYDRVKRSSEKNIRIWCAGCSSGEEPYTFNMLIKDFIKKQANQIPVQVLATDISTDAITKADRGVYPTESLKDIPKDMLNRYFEKVSEAEWRVKSLLKSNIMFKRLNLMNEKFPFKNKFHMIFCRNVMIYFDDKTKKELAAKFSDNLVDNGYLFIGHSETLGRTNENFSYIMPALYVKKSTL